MSDERYNPLNLRVKCFYRIDNHVLYCVRYTWHANSSGPDIIDMEGIRPEDYAAYITHQVLGEQQAPYRTLAEIECIPFPDPVEVHFSSDAKIERISKVDALQKSRDER